MSPQPTLMFITCHYIISDRQAVLLLPNHNISLPLQILQPYITQLIRYEQDRYHDDEFIRLNEEF